MESGAEESGNVHQSTTSLSLLAALRDDIRQHQAWHEFVARYGPRIEGWCRRWGLQQADVEDVTQNVLFQLSRQMQQFQYDANGRFRSWLKTVTWRAWAKFLEARRRSPATAENSALLELLDSRSAQQQLLQQLDEEANREILDVAMRQVQLRVKPSSWQAFCLMTFEGKSGAETAVLLQMQPGAVFVAKSRVDRMLAEEVRRIDPEAAMSRECRDSEH